MSLENNNNIIVYDGNNCKTVYLSLEPPSLQKAYDLIGCSTVQLIQCDDGSQILMDENGKLKNDWLINDEATSHWQQSLKVPLWDVVAGNAIILTDKAVWV
tara:strand:- start:11 stop:313 length:303 start_codon:yes stop_codon:yes gene_type:complete